MRNHWRWIGTLCALIAVISAGLVGSTSPAHSAVEIARSSDIFAAKYGVFVHYVAGLTRDNTGAIVTDVNQLADDFDADSFADDLADFGVEYVKFTAWHAAMIPLYPSAVQTAWRGSGTSSTRDVISDMIDAVSAKGIAVVLYTHPRVGHSFDEADMASTGWGSGGTTWCNPPAGALCDNPNPQTFDFATWNDFVQEAYAELLTKYGTRISGIYIDEGDATGQSQNVVDYPKLYEMIKAYNLPIFHNYFGNQYTADISDTEYTYNGGFNISTGTTGQASAYTAASPLITGAWWTNGAATATATNYSVNSLYKYTVLQAATNRTGGGVAWAAGVYPGGGWEKDVASTLTQVGTRVKAADPSIRRSFPSPSYPVADGTKVSDLTWGVATRSGDDLATYIHVLTPPTGATVTLPAPADGKQFASARLLTTGQTVTVSQSTSGVTLTLPNGVTWDSVDTVIELTTGHAAIAKTVTATSSVENSEWGVSRSVDGNVRSAAGARGWSSSSNLTSSHTEAITVDLGAAQNVTDVVLAPRTDLSDFGQGFPVDFTIATSTDGSTWTTQVTVNDAPIPTTRQQYAFPRTSARYIRIQGTELRPNPNDSYQYRMVVAEIAVRDRPPTGSGLVLSNLYHRRNLQSTAVVVSSGVNDVVITPWPRLNAEARWSIADNGGGWYTITDDYRGMRLTGTSTHYPGRTDVNLVRESSAALNDAQLWRFTPDGDGTYRIENKQYAMLLHGAGAQYPGFIDVNSVVMVPTSWFGDEQRWSIVKH